MTWLAFMVQWIKMDKGDDDTHSKQRSSLPRGPVLAFFAWSGFWEANSLFAFWGVEDTSCPFGFLPFPALSLFIAFPFILSMYKVPTDIHNNTRHP